MKYYSVDFLGGLSREDAFTGCNYLICNCVNLDGDDVELYAEYLLPKNKDAFEEWLLPGYSMDDFKDENDLIDWEAANEAFDLDRFDRVSYPILLKKIFEQAKEENVDPSCLSYDDWRLEGLDPTAGTQKDEMEID